VGSAEGTKSVFNVNVGDSSPDGVQKSVIAYLEGPCKLCLRSQGTSFIESVG
jgi:hypothetical protein